MRNSISAPRPGQVEAPARELASAPISRSWKRCASYGLDPHAPQKAALLTKPELRMRQQEHEALFRRCLPELETLRRVAATSQSVAILADPSGLILDSLGATSFNERALDAALQPGALWSEEARGTNGIGAVLMELRPLSVRGAEHYFETNRFLDCAAAPIITPFGEVAGVLNVSAPASAVSAHALGLVELAVDQIEHRFFQEGFEHCSLIRFHSNKAMLGTPREGILVFKGSRLVAANRHGLSLTSLDWKDLGGREAESLFDVETDGHPRISGREIKDQAGHPFYFADDESRAKPHYLSWQRIPDATLSTPIYDARMQSEIERARRVVECGLPVVVSGETGSGKEVFARHLHALSNRSRGPFLAVNCAALPESLIESELFGYAEGAFTGAKRQGSKGMIREADGGTLLLDEIGDMPLALQSRLLRVLQERQVTPLGSGKPVDVNFALICATHRDLRGLVAENRFRQDLYYRISQYCVELEPVRSHPDRRRLVLDAWAQAGASAAHHTFTPAALDVLAAYDWPGNYREMCGMMRAILALAHPYVPVGVDDLPKHVHISSPVAVVEEEIRPGNLEVTKLAVLRRALDQHNGNISKAAKSLGVSRGLFYRKLFQSSFYKI